MVDLLNESAELYLLFIYGL